MAVIDIVSIVVGAIVLAGILFICVIVDHREKASIRLYRVLFNLSKYVEEAETMFASGQGEAKLKYVISQVKVDCINNKVKLTEEVIKSYIERILDTPRKKLSNNTTQHQVVQSRPNVAPVNTIPGQAPRENQNKGV